MGDLSIVIEDESNMINLWDFAGNPAGFLADEEGPTVRGDFLWNTYQIKDLVYYDYRYPSGYTKYKADGDRFDKWASVGFRNEDDFALGVEGNHLSQETDSKYWGNELESPKVSLIFTKSLDPATTFGANLSYLEEDFEYWAGTSPSKEKWETTDFRAKLGLKRKFTPSVILGGLLGYDSFKGDEKAHLSDSYTFWLSGQTVVEIKHKLKLGIETGLAFQRADFYLVFFGGSSYDGDKKEHYYFSFLRLRGTYDVSPKLRLGLFYFDRELIGAFYPPGYILSPLPGYEVYVRHWGVGGSYKFNKRILAGAEYHFRDSSQPSSGFVYNWGLKNESLNLGIEGRVSESLVLRGGFIRTETNQNPNFDKRRDSWENKLTSGFGYQLRGSSLILELSYSYALHKFKQYYGSSDLELNGHAFSLSFKNVF